MSYVLQFFIAAIATVTFAILLEPSSNEYSVCVCRCTNAMIVSSPFSFIVVSHMCNYYIYFRLL